MKKIIINSIHAPEPIGPYNQAIGFNNLIFTSGQIPLDPQTGEVVQGGIIEQTHQVLKNLDAVLLEAGSNCHSVLKMTVFLKNMKDFPEVNRIYAEYFEKNSAPARSTVEVSQLPKNVLIEIEAVAVKQD